jgi:CTP:molybdopterin cytidylyltransferase MocA
VCPADRKEIGERLNDRFVIAVNKKPKNGLGHSIAVGVQVALQFKPDAMLFVMGDMPFVEEPMLRGLISQLGGHGGADIVHSGGAGAVSPPTAFGPACFKALAALDGDDGAKSVIRSGGFNVTGAATAAPLLADVDTKEDIEFARSQLAIREKYPTLSEVSESCDRAAAPPTDLSQYRAGIGAQAVQR